MKYPKEYLDEIKTRLKVSTVVSKSVSLKKRGKEFVGLSPFKTEKTPSFTVNDSNHTTDHVYSELELYSPLVSRGSYCIVFDTLVGDMPKNTYKNRAWNQKNNPKIAVKKFLKNNNKFVIDDDVYKRFLITTAREGYLKKIK